MALQKTNIKEITTDDINSFFDGIMEKIEEDRQSMLIGTASDEKAKMFEKFISNDKDAILEMNWLQTSRAILNGLFIKYFDDLKNTNLNVSKLAFKLKATEMNVFAIVNDDDRDSINTLFKTDAKFMSEFRKKGFRLNTLVFENSDEVTIPKDYKELSTL